MTTGLLIVLLFLVLMAMSLPVFVAMALAGFVGFVLAHGWTTALYGFTETVWQSTHVYELIAIPLFILTGTIMQQSGAGRDLYLVVNAFAGRVRNASASPRSLLAAYSRRFAAHRSRPPRRSAMWRSPHSRNPVTAILVLAASSRPAAAVSGGCSGAC